MRRLTYVGHPKMWEPEQKSFNIVGLRVLVLLHLTIHLASHHIPINKEIYHFKLARTKHFGYLKSVGITQSTQRKKKASIDCKPADFQALNARKKLHVSCNISKTHPNFSLIMLSTLLFCSRLASNLKKKEENK